MNPELQTERFLEVLAPSSPTMFAWLQESRKDCPGMQVATGRIEDLRPMLEAKNAEGCGIFVLVNESTDPARRTASCISKVRAVWADIDAPGSQLPVLPLDPSLTVQTPGGWHVYYVLDTPSLDKAWGVGMNHTLVGRVGGDVAACDVARVMRLPGFYHCKGEPRMVELVEDCGYRYGGLELEDALGPPSSPATATLVQRSGEGGPDSESTPYGLAAASREVLVMARTPRGQGLRNRALCRGAFKLGQLVGGGELNIEDAWRTAGAGADRMGYTADHGEAATAKCINASVRAGIGAPRGSGLPIGQSIGQCQEVSDRASNGSLDALRDGLLDRVRAGIDRRIELGFAPAPSPMEGLNRSLGGGAPAGAVTLLGAPPGMGKSSLALHWAAEYAKSGKPALYCSLELSELDLYARLCTLEHTVPWIEVRCGKHRDKLLETVQASLHVPFYAADRHRIDTVEKLSQSVVELGQKHGSPPLVVIDYLQMLIPLGEAREQWAVMGDISAKVAHLAQDTGSPLLCITAINRQSYKIADGGGMPDRYMALSAAKQSGRLEYDAEVIMALQLCDVQQGGRYGWVCIAKNRSGGDAGNVGVRYDGLSGRFYDADPKDVMAAMAAEREVGKQGTEVELMAKLVGVLEGGVVRGGDELLKRAGVSRGKGRSVLMKMVESGEVIRGINGEFTLGGNEDGMERNRWGSD